MKTNTNRVEPPALYALVTVLRALYALGRAGDGPVGVVCTERAGDGPDGIVPTGTRW